METFTRGYLVIFKSHLLLVVSLIFAALHRLWWLNDYHFLVLYGYTPSLDGRDPMIVSWILNYELMDFLNFMANRGYLAQKTLNNQNDLEWVNTIYIYTYVYIYIYIYICRTLSPHQKLALQKLVSQLPSQIRWFSVLSGEPKKNIQHIYELFGKSRVRCLNIYIYIYIYIYLSSISGLCLGKNPSKFISLRILWSPGKSGLKNCIHSQHDGWYGYGANLDCWYWTIGSLGIGLLIQLDC